MAQPAQASPQHSTVAGCLAGQVRAGRWQLLADGKLGANGCDMLIKLGGCGDARLCHPPQRDLPDMAGHPKGRSRQLSGRFCHITTITDNR